MNDETYCYPPDYTVLKNKAGLRDAHALERFERLKTLNRARYCPFDFPMTYKGYCAIHYHLFQDVYGWAGEPRLVPMSKGHSLFEPPERIGGEMRRVFKELEGESYLRDLPPAQFAAKASRYLDDLNITHPFREGNGRTQRLFLRNLAHRAGHTLHITRIDRQQWMDASIAGMHRSDHGLMTDVIRSALAGRSRAFKSVERDR